MNHPKVAILYARFGPYHVARLRGAATVFEPKGWEVMGLEVCPDDRFYAWDKVADAGDLRRIGLFPGRVYGELSRKEIQAAVRRALDFALPDAVACPGWFYAEALAGADWCCRNRKPAILMSESGRQDQRRVWWREWLKRRSIRRFDCALVGGRIHAEYLRELGMPSERIAYGHNVVDNDHFSTGAAEARKDATRLRQSLGLPERYLLSSGRFVEKKNFGRLLSAYRAYRDTAPNRPLELVVCGDGPLRAGLQEQARALGLSGDIHWPGFVQYDTLPAYYGLAAAFILPSTSEPWGLVVNEAMASGLPVLVSQTAGCHFDLLEETGNGFLFDPYQVESMAAAITRFHALPGSSCKAMARRSQDIIADWRPRRFGDGLWRVIEASGRRGGK